MEKSRLYELAGVSANETEVLYAALMEVVQLPEPEDITIEDLVRRMEHCKRAMSLCAKLQGADKKKWLSATFVNMNKIRAALKKMLAAQPDADVKPIKVQQPTAPGVIPGTDSNAPGNVPYTR